MSTVPLVERVRDDTISERKGWKGVEGWVMAVIACKR
jgi:hypothetical protein